MNNSRRDFLKKAGIGILGTYVGSSLLHSCTTATTTASGPFGNVGLQVYSLRDLIGQDPKLTLETVAKIGYKHIETFGVDVANNSFWGLKVDELKKILQDNNLASYSGHYDMSKYLDPKSNEDENIDRYIEIANTLGQKYIIAPVTPMHSLNDMTPADYQYAAEQLNKAGEKAQKAGIKIGYHNHFWEFREFANGTKGLDILIAMTEPNLVSFELDMYWAEKSGINPLSYFEKYPGRFPLWHLKDMDKAFSEPIVGEKFDKAPLDSIFGKIKYTELGTGAINYINLATGAEKAGLEYAFVEQDDIYMPNKFDSIKKSYDYVQKFLAK